jgi:hypothetical protein
MSDQPCNCDWETGECQGPLGCRAVAEVVRLRELKTPASRELLNITKGCLDSTEAEIKQLRAVLRSIAWEHTPAGEAARHALGEKT